MAAGQWSAYQARQANCGAARSYSYATGNESDALVLGTPDSVSNSRIIGSYLFRSAGSKAPGNY